VCVHQTGYKTAPSSIFYFLLLLILWWVSIKLYLQFYQIFYHFMSISQV